MSSFTRRSIILATAGLAAAGVGVTASESEPEGSVEGQADVQAEQALTVADVTIRSSDQDVSFTRTSDDNTEFQAAVELNNGDSVLFDAEVENSAADDLDVQVAVDSPDPIDIDVRKKGNSSNDSSSGNSNLNGNGASSGAVQTGEETFITTINRADTDEGSQINSVAIFAKLSDTADPGSYDISVAINPLSTD
ncbi:hypothetical protein [Haloquadratum walsbyi]|jgi:hypothetical protein|uniref:Uncharacterized protein n=1 Tax=Haloquadratum walsbyi J07HQW2 TaxID=1238425 RepID=U1NFH5_9EURY|nr:hypothetical protein [Haloquadratum walsbyi]ERG95825.1 MAG: hypothetical protein J07HQW2_02285 [Haloquadratum walsbyi J07HQW2]